MKYVLLLLVLLGSTTGFAQAPIKYWVFFQDKDSTQAFHPAEFYHSKALARRVRMSQPLNDPRDWPVKEQYLATLSGHADSMGSVSRWFNATGAWLQPQQVPAVQNLPFVKEVQPMSIQLLPAEVQEDSWKSSTFMRHLRLQTGRMQGQFFREKGYDGSGIRIAVLDAGFPYVGYHPSFRHLRDSNHIVATYDFIKKQEDVFGANSHGAMVLSCIGGYYPCEKCDPVHDVPMGLATGAEYLLARTERGFTEFFSEEDNWVAAMEWADQHGADIINSSLGYTYHRYFPNDMNGRTALVTQAANRAASLGILVVNSAGNDGNTRWRSIGAPADADSVLSVGGTEPYTDAAINFSSFGPTADLRLKPNLTAFGRAVVAKSSGWGYASGTSFSAPLVAGFAACAWQTDTSMTNMELFQLLEQSGSLYPYYDYRHGYGVPQASFFMDRQELQVDYPEGPAPFDIQLTDTTVNVVLNTSFAEALRLGDEQMKPMNLYYHIATPDGVLRQYGVVRVESNDPLSLPISTFVEDDILRIHLEGYTDTFNFKPIHSIHE